MTSAIQFEIKSRSTEHSGRCGVVHTPHGSFNTPAFMPVATAAAMKGVLPGQVRELGAEIVLNNAYHLMLRPGAELVDRMGGAHTFMRWDGPILTDSGGYQAFSMADINALDEDGVSFRSFVSGEQVHMSPESSMEVQNAIGADIIMAFDDCPPSPHARADASSPRARLPQPADWARRQREAHERTLRWLDRCVKAHARSGDQGLFGIVQGGLDLELRAASVEGVCSHDLPGYAIGGVAVGEGPDDIRRVVEHTAPLLPEDRPRYLMGVGTPEELVRYTAMGFDLFDCVLPTRNARNGMAFTSRGRIAIRNAAHREDSGPLDPDCDCTTCTRFGRAYLRHLFVSGEILAARALTTHNLHFYLNRMGRLRRAIDENRFEAEAEDFLSLTSSETGPASATREN